MTKAVKQHPRLSVILFVLTCVVAGWTANRVRAREVASTSLKDDANLQAYYQLENDGTDRQGNYNLSLINSPTFVGGKYGRGMNLGTSNTGTYANATSSLGITGGAISISVWVKLNTEISGEGTVYAFAHQGNNTNNVEYLISYSIQSGVKYVRFDRIRQFVGGGDALIQVPYTLGTTDWHHLVLTYDGTTLYGYVDNVKSSGLAASGNGSSGSSNNFTLGAQYYGYPTELANAIIDDAAVFNRALNDSEVSSLYYSLGAQRTDDKTISSNATPAPDGELTLALGNRSYAIEGVIFAKSTNGAPGIKFDLSATSASAFTVGYIAVNDTIQTGGVLTATGSTAIVPATANDAIPIHISGTVTMSQPGNLNFEWSQNVSDPDAMTVMKGSYLHATEL